MLDNFPQKKKNMNPLFLKVYFLDPTTKKEFLISDGIEVDVVNVRINPSNLIVEYFDPLKLTADPQSQIFYVDAPNYQVTRSHRIRVGFSKPNFSIPLKKLLSANEIDQESLPVFCPSCLPYWDSRDQGAFQIQKYSSSKALRIPTSIENPLILKVPIRQIYNIGHRGAPHHYPENTMASFNEALKLGANGLELDLCLTKDKKIIVFHDPKPVNLISPINRINIENLPYALISPKFVPKNDGLYAVIAEYRDGNYVEVPSTKPLNSLDEYDIANLMLEQVRQIYRYRHTPDKVEHPIPTFEEFLSFAGQESNQKPSRLQFLYFDIKNPGWNEKRDAERFVEFGSLIGNILRRYSLLPEELVIGYTHPKGLGHLKRGIEKLGEKRCEFAYDAPGSLAALVESFPRGFLNHFLGDLLGKFMGNILGSFLGRILRKALLRLAGKNYNPLKVAKAMKNTVVSIGCLGRPKNLEEIKEAIYDCDTNINSPIKTIIHYTLNDPEQMVQSLNIGVNGIITDKPDEFRQILESLGISILPPLAPSLSH
jgi:glycerophosphoryl diester phosphodiesterase